MKILITESQLEKIISEEFFDADTITDIVSGLIDVVPGVGNMISAGIDVSHALSYIVRYNTATADEMKMEMAIMALITLGTAFVPMGGNMANVVIRGEIKSLLRKTPAEILKIGKNMGIIKGNVINLSKDIWKYSLLIALYKMFKIQVVNVLAGVVNTLTSISNKSNQLKPHLNRFIADINQVRSLMA